MENAIYEELLNLPNLCVEEVVKEPNMLKIYCKSKNTQSNCPNCGSQCTRIHQYSSTTIRDLSIADRRVYLILQKPQFQCEDCGRYFLERLSWVEDGASYTNRQAKWMFNWSIKLPFTEVAAQIDLSAKTVERSFYATIEKAQKNSNKWLKVKHLGIDELALRKGKKSYVCVLTNLETGEVIDLLPERSKAYLSEYFGELKKEIREQVEQISFDMWDAYQQIATIYFPKARQVVDRFHVVKQLNDEANKTVIREARQAKPSEKDLKHLRWSFFKQEKNLSEEEQIKLQSAFALFPSLKKAHELREQFHFAMESSQTPSELSSKLDDWAETSKAQGFFAKFTATLKRWQDKIANFAQTQLTNATTEGINNKLRSVLRFTFGMSNFSNFKRRVFALDYS